MYVEKRRIKRKKKEPPPRVPHRLIALFLSSPSLSSSSYLYFSVFYSDLSSATFVRWKLRPKKIDQERDIKRVLLPAGPRIDERGWLNVGLGRRRLAGDILHLVPSVYFFYFSFVPFLFVPFFISSLRCRHVRSAALMIHLRARQFEKTRKERH